MFVQSKAAKVTHILIPQSSNKLMYHRIHPKLLKTGRKNVIGYLAYIKNFILPVNFERNEGVGTVLHMNTSMSFRFTNMVIDTATTAFRLTHFMADRCLFRARTIAGAAWDPHFSVRTPLMVHLSRNNWRNNFFWYRTDPTWNWWMNFSNWRNNFFRYRTDFGWHRRMNFSRTN
jgi:hypothetical protein